jgi:flagella basal body P-ring formation protein FlgA
MMIRIAALIALIAVASPAAAQIAGTGTSEAPTLKSAVTVTGEIVRIGDLIENAGVVAEVPIFRAPDLGQTGSVPSSRVIDAVRPHQIIGLNTRGIAEVMVTRASRAITAKDIEARVVGALAGQYGLPDAKNLAVLFDNTVRTLQVESAANSELSIARLTYEPRTGRFDVAFELPGSAVARRLPLRFTGSLTETFETAVSARALAQGDVLKASDLVIERRPKAEFTAATVTTIEQVLGLAVRNPMRPGQVIRQADVAKLELVQRNEVISIVYEAPGIRLTIRGKALEPGAQGDVINVLNIESKRTIQATVAGPGRVTVGAAARFATNASPALPDSANVQRGSAE